MRVRWIVHAARKFCEIHVVMNSLTAIALAESVRGDLALGKFYLAFAAPLALATAIATLARDIHRGAAEQEFARWYRTLEDAPPGHRRDGAVAERGTFGAALPQPPIAMDAVIPFSN